MPPPSKPKNPPEEAGSDDESVPPATPTPQHVVNVWFDRNARANEPLAVRTKDSNPFVKSDVVGSQRLLLSHQGMQEQSAHVDRPKLPTTAWPGARPFASRGLPLQHHRPSSIPANLSQQRVLDNAFNDIKRTTMSTSETTHPSWQLGYHVSKPCAACRRTAKSPVLLVCACSQKQVFCANHFDLFQEAFPRCAKHSREEEEVEETSGSMFKRSRRDSGLGSPVASVQHNFISGLVGRPQSTPPENRLGSSFLYSDGAQDVRVETVTATHTQVQRFIYRDIGVQTDEVEVNTVVSEVSAYYDAHTSLNAPVDNGQPPSPSRSPQPTSPASPVTEESAAVQGLPISQTTGGLPLSPSKPLSPLASYDLLDLSSFPSSQPPDNYYDTPPGFGEDDELNQTQESDQDDTCQQGLFSVSANQGSNVEFSGGARTSTLGGATDENRDSDVSMSLF
ncbi:hypothetical protein M407DRAFT_34067 [Tulasnella calospora MUT 4182]|uniref:Uncharacterized protein n=1 Tax=Tulasnella calospora MUT 4182 TaxID=1051891 RepID=A0A0C3PP82_9AGAM|nr:hypothetical protein M407DRAFT_34067 [Tulasnella calospora MUT 4182]